MVSHYLKVRYTYLLELQVLNLVEYKKNVNNFEIEAPRAELTWSLK
jgi:hypothetical protein